MKSKQIIIFFFILTVCIFSIGAQDLITLRDGNMIEARVTEISRTEIRYWRYDNLGGPIYVISVEEVLSIRYENGIMEVINADSTRLQAESAQTETTPVQESVQTENNITEVVQETIPQSPRQPTPPSARQENPQTTVSASAPGNSTAMDPDRWIFSIAADPSGLLFSRGFAISAELTRGWFYNQVSIRFSGSGLFGMGLSLNYFHHTRLGGFFIGTSFQYTSLGGEYEYEYGRWDYNWYYDDEIDDFVDTSKYNTYTATWNNYEIILALNLGYKFVFSSGLYIRASCNLGYVESNDKRDFGFRPDISFGYSF